MYDPTSMAPGSIMPMYPWLFENDLDTKYTAAKIKVHQSLGAPYPDGYADKAVADLQAQAKKVVANLAKDNIKQDGIENKEIVALIAYLQRLGTDIKVDNQNK